MSGEKVMMPFRWRVYGIGVIALGMTCLVFGDFDPGQSAPHGFPTQTTLAYTAGAFMIIAGAAVEWFRTIAWGAAALAVYYTLFVVVQMNGRLLLTDYGVYGTHEEIALQLVLAAGGLIVYVTSARNAGKIDAALAARLMRLGRLAFGGCAGMGRSAFCLYELHRPAGAKMAAADARVLGLYDRSLFRRGGGCDPDRRAAPLASILLTVIIACFGVLANGRALLADPSSHFNWAECALNLALVGAAWVQADSLTRPRNWLG